MVRDDGEPVPVIASEAVIRPDALPALDGYPAEAAAPADEIVTPAPRWLLVGGSVFVAAVVVVCFLVFWRGMGTAPRQSAVEAFGVAFGLMVVVSIIGAFVQSAHDGR
jgi:hypothetical protein